ncbi:MAG TPA: YfhO family protein, partial [Thermoanaerobaculia bacterium]|nr:YfhO family protein [Thermoanaerobaculia bacterium]
ILDSRLERIDQGRFLPFRIYRDPAALPRWFLPASAEAIDPARLDAWIAGLRDPARVALWKAEVGDWLPPARPAAVPARAVSAVPGRIVLEVPGDEERLLATSVPALPGWRVRSGGRDLPLVTVNGAYLGVRVPAGTREVELRFMPRGLVAGAVLGGLAVIILILLTLGTSQTMFGNNAGFRRWIARKG